MKPLTSIAGVALSVIVLAGATALTSAVSHAAPEDDVEAAFDALVEAWNDEDIEAFAGHFTDDGVAYQFYGLTGDEALEAIAGDRDALGPITASSIANIEVAGNDATAEVELEFEAGFTLYEEWPFSLVDDAWLAGPGTPLFRPIPAGVPAVPLTLQEYAFVYDAAAVAGGNFGFEVTNAGQEEHEVLLVGLAGTGPVTDVVDAVLETDELPESAEFVSVSFFPPGVQGTVVLPEPLAAGRYALLCFFPAPDETPHAVLGMVSEFSVGAGGGVTAPSAGNAGLVAKSGGVPVPLLLAVGGLVVLLALAGATKARASKQAGR